jgi:MFS family permease
MQIPSNLFLNKTGKPAIYLPTCMIIWGIISGATGACQNFGGLVACRFFLGFIEAAYFPGCQLDYHLRYQIKRLILCLGLFYLSSWYTRKELGLRTAVLYSGSLISGAFGGLITAGITSNMDGTQGLRAWRWYDYSISCRLQKLTSRLI